MKRLLVAIVLLLPALAPNCVACHQKDKARASAAPGAPPHGPFQQCANCHNAIFFGPNAQGKFAQPGGRESVCR